VLKTPIENLSWVEGAVFADRVPPLRFSIEGNESFEWCDYFRPAVNIPLFSPLLRTALERAGVDNVDYYDAIVTHSASGTSRSYFAANVIGLVAAVDRALSIFEPFDGSASLVNAFDKLVLKNEVASDLRLFRLSEFDLLIVADANVRDAVTRSGTIGVIFLEPDKWDGFAT
jgi:hypothetical protein